MKVIKWVFDRTTAFFGLIILCPLMMLVAIVIKLKMPKGPIIFKQKRVGQHARLFNIYKFRTMVADHDGNSISVAGESRITSLGKILRKYKIDELPELWNVLKGDMSFVGPRPDVPGYADCLQGRERDILSLKPGITGPASLKYRNEEELLAIQEDSQKYNDEVIYPDKTRINLYYLDHYSFWNDLQIILCTVLGRQMTYNGERI